MNTQLHYWELLRGFWRLLYVTDDFGNLLIRPKHDVWHYVWFAYGSTPPPAHWFD